VEVYRLFVGVNVQESKGSGAKIVVFSSVLTVLGNDAKIDSYGSGNGYWKGKLIKH
jgi:hypothetical protein